ncbi:MAG: hypothetical protein WDW38_007412 [Sanguina aurantia]
MSALSVALPRASSALEVTIAPSTTAAVATGSSSLATYTDTADRFTLEVPSDWQQGEGVLGGNSSFSGASGGRRTIAWFPSDGDGNTSLSIVITNVSVEFTKLGSFGSAYQLGTNLVNIQDKSNLLRQPKWARKKEDIIQIALLVDAKESRDMYQIEYTVRKEEEAQRHLYSVLALAPNGRYNRLYTVTAQCLEQDLPTLKPVLSAMLASFTPPRAVSI